MISQILGFTVLFILVFGGIIGAIIKFTLMGSVKANLSNRIAMADERIESALKQTNDKPDTKRSETSAQSARKTVCGIDSGFGELSKL
ncbi:MAG: hypothetical protein K2J67_11000 [Lachnospiraceae bacterium]|nr:hypothetical protein [Lachnospiraceae bacterium]